LIGRPSHRLNSRISVGQACFGGNALTECIPPERLPATNDGSNRSSSTSITLAQRRTQSGRFQFMGVVPGDSG
jgi:hypothetical protein